MKKFVLRINNAILHNLVVQSEKLVIHEYLDILDYIFIHVDLSFIVKKVI